MLTLLLTTPFAAAYGGSGNERAYAVLQTQDGSLVISGYTSSVGAGEEDFFLLKTDELGAPRWFRAFGGSGLDQAYSLDSYPNGDLILSGRTTSFGEPWGDILLLRVSSSGALLWATKLGGSDSEYPQWASATSDGGCVAVATTYSYDVSKGDILVVKLDSLGALQWSKDIGTDNHDKAAWVLQTPDGGYLIAGRTDCLWGQGYDALVVKLDSLGALQWKFAYGGSEDEYLYSATLTSDGGFALLGGTESYGAGLLDLIFLKLDALGALEWARAIGGSKDDYPCAVIQASDGGYLLTSGSNSYSAGDYDATMVKLDSSGNLRWAASFGGALYDWVSSSAAETADSEFVAAGLTTNYGSGGYDAILFTVRADGTSDGCVPNHLMSVAEISPEEASPGLQVRDITPTVSQPQVECDTTTLSTTPICSPSGVSGGEAEGASRCLPCAGGLLFYVPERAELLLYSADGRLRKALTLGAGWSRVSLERGIYFWVLGGASGKGVVLP